MHCATLILAGVMDHKRTKIDTRPSTQLVKTLRFAALLHDIGHLPFSHAVEKNWLQGLRHEDLSKYIIENYEPIYDIIDKEDVSPSSVALLLAKEPPAKYKLVHEIVSGQLDADRADYLLRDSHSCGVKYGEYDFSRYLQIFAAVESGDSGHLSLCIDENDLHVAESLLIARYHYNLQVPFHRTRSGYDLALRRFMKDFSEYTKPFIVENNQLIKVDFDSLVDLDDYTIMERAKKEIKGKNKWAPYLLRNSHMIPIIDTSTNSEKGQRLFKTLVGELEKSDSFTLEEDYFFQEEEVKIIKSVRSDEIPIGENGIHDPQFSVMLMSSEGKGRQTEFVDISERSWIFKQLTTKEPPKVLRVYVTPDKEDDVRSLLSKLES
ncbi:HD domain-containing protein [Oceanidesulfovibrio marinus]|uniref:HD domain-containing protein n=2 Tax=Oceanidesulfovibrio marinus TaxID=370038 RepID=A0A6P1ZN13_9BACT|nr:HD domain-containing protein [Oceanidesulfovibrio marinus]